MTSTDAPRRQGTGRWITFYVVLAVFAQESTWNFYDAQVPPLLAAYVGSAAVVGLLMGVDNLLGIFIQPWMGHRSDNTRTRWGRRIPYLAVGMPIAAVLFAAIPLTSSLPALVAVMVGYALLANSCRPPTESLLPDFISPERRGRANAAVKIAVGVTVIVSALISLLLVDEHPVLAFAVPSVLMLVSVAVLVARVRDSSSPAYQAVLAAEHAAEHAADLSDAPPPARLRDVLSDIVRATDRSRLLVIVATFLFACAWSAVRAQGTNYGIQSLGLTRGDAGGLTLAGGVAFLLAAFPIALLAERVGRLRVMALGIAVVAAALVAGTALHTPAATAAVFCVAAVGAAGFAVNGAVVLWNLAPSAGVLGAYTALYTVGWSLGGFLGPAVVGALVDLTGWRFMLVDAALLAVLAVLVVLRVITLRRRAPEHEAVAL
jgi:MFS family permease